MKDIKEFFRENFEAALHSIEIDNPFEEKFVIVPTTEVEKYTTMDDIYRMRITPMFSGVRISYESVVSNLIKDHKKLAPLWIKIYKEKDKPVILFISQRYRKMRDIILRRRDNNFPPFEISEEPLLDFGEAQERLQAIRILFFKRMINDELKQYVGDRITILEVKDIFQLHFENHRFYPSAYNHFKKGEEAYSSLVLDKDFETNKFSIFKNPETEDKLKSNLNFEEAIQYYIREELKFKLCGIEIENQKLS